MAVALDVFGKKVTELVLNSKAPWVKPWGANQAKGLPVNALTGKAYRGCNVMLLLATPFVSRGWMTFKQVSSLGGKVLKGSKASDIEIARRVIDIKAQIEKIREQIQNIE